MQLYPKDFIDLLAINAHQKVYHHYNGHWRTDKVSQHDKKQIRADVRRVLFGFTPIMLHNAWRVRRANALHQPSNPWAYEDLETRTGFEIFCRVVSDGKALFDEKSGIYWGFLEWPGEGKQVQVDAVRAKAKQIKHSAELQKKAEREARCDELDRLLFEKRQRDAKKLEVAQAGFHAALCFEQSMLPETERTLSAWADLSGAALANFIECAERVMATAYNSCYCVAEPTRNYANSLGVKFGVKIISNAFCLVEHPIAAPTWDELPQIWKYLCDVVFISMKAKFLS